MRFPRLLFIPFLLLSCKSGPESIIPLDLAQEHRDHAEPWVYPTSYPDRITLNITEDPSTGFSITWRTDTLTTRALVQIAEASADPAFTEDARAIEVGSERADFDDSDLGELSALYHSVTLTDLKANQDYAYRVGNGELWSEWFHTKTASKNDDAFTFLYVGDAQNGLHSHWSRVIRQAHLEAPDASFFIHAGDLVNRAHRNNEWGEWFHAGGWIHSMLPTVAVPGNHEYQTNEDTEQRELSEHWRPQFTLPMNGPENLPETAYYFEYQGVLFIGLDSNRDLNTQTSWLESVLAKSDHKWKIMTFHHPIYSPAGDRDNDDQRKAWKPLLDKYGVDLVLQGHDHTYARGHDTNLPTGEKLVDAEVGTVYVVSVSGAKMYDVKKSKWEQYGAKMVRSGEDTQLYQVITVDGDSLRYRSHTAVGDLFDSFDLIKGEGPNQLITNIPILE